MTDTLLQASITVLAVALTAWFALESHYRQREHELIISRYLEGSLDLLAAEVERVMAIFNHNWARSLQVLKSYRDLGDDFDRAELAKGFVELQSSNLNVVAHHKLHSLVGTHSYWQVYQLAMSFFTSANSTLVADIPDAIRMKLSGSERIDAPHGEIAEEGFQLAREVQDRSHKFVTLLSELQLLSSILETTKLRFKSLSGFSNRRDVRESITRLENSYREELAEFAGESGLTDDDSSQEKGVSAQKMEVFEERVAQQRPRT